MEFKDYYKVMGVERDAAQAEARKILENSVDLRIGSEVQDQVTRSTYHRHRIRWPIA